MKESDLNTALSSIWTKSYVYVSKTTILDISIYIIYNFMALCQDTKNEATANSRVKLNLSLSDIGKKNLAYS